MKLLYKYSNGKTIEHTKFVNKKTIIKEAENAKTVSIYQKLTNNTKFITTLLLK